jgi:glycosyltransferase involved in cell wall biosynthesis
MGKPIRILAFYPLFIYEYGKLVSGIDRRFLEISSRLKSLGVEIFTLEYEPSISESWGYSSYHSIKLNRRFKGHGIIETIRLIIHGLRTCIKLNCDLIYVPGWINVGGLRIILPPYIVSLFCRKPLVVVLHHVSRHTHSNRWGIIFRIIRLLVYQHTAVCITVSQAVASDIIKAFKVKHTIVTGNGVTLSLFSNVKSQTKNYDAIYFGRISKEKGICTLLEAWKIITRKLPYAKLVLVGGIEQNMKHIYKNIIKRLGLDQNVTFVGFVTDQQAVNLLSSSKIFILPSTEEGFGLTIIEAMAVGLPCIVSDLPALQQNFHEVAIFVKPNDAEKLAESISELLSDSEKRKKLQEKGQRLAKQFSWEAVAKKELEVFKRVLNTS